MEFSQVEANKRALCEAKARAKATAEVKSRVETKAETETMMAAVPASNQFEAQATSARGFIPSTQMGKELHAAPLGSPVVMNVGSSTLGATPTPFETPASFKGKSPQNAPIPTRPWPW